MTAPAETARLELRLALTAIQFFTRLPVPSWVGHSAEHLQQAMRYFPFVGIVVGGLATLVFEIAARVWPSNIAVLAAVIAGILVTGGFHEDGLADTCDGIGAGPDRDRVLEVMKDPRVGSYGALALTLILLVKVAALDDLATSSVPAALIAAHAFSRLMALSIVESQPYVRTEGPARARAAAGPIKLGAFLWAGVIGIIPLIFLGRAGLGAAAAAIAARLGVGWYLRRTLGGYTGDCLGAVQQLTEAVFYLALAA